MFMSRKIPTTIRTMFEVVYPESLGMTIDDLVVRLGADEWSYILHDKDTLESGEFKKPHYHLYIKWYNPVSHSWVAKILNFSSNYAIATARNKRACHQYMLHITQDARIMKKHEYNQDELHSNISDLKALIRDTIDLRQDKFNEIFYQIDRFNRQEISANEFFVLLNKKDLLEFYNKFYNSVFRKMIVILPTT